MKRVIHVITIVESTNKTQYDFGSSLKFNHHEKLLISAVPKELKKSSILQESEN